MSVGQKLYHKIGQANAALTGDDRYNQVYSKADLDYVKKIRGIEEQTERTRKQTEVEKEVTSQLKEKGRRVNANGNLMSSNEERGQEKGSKSNITGGVLNRLRVSRMALGTPESKQGTEDEKLGAEDELYGKKRS